MQAVPVDDDNDSSVMPLDNQDHDSTQRQIFANFAKLKQETNGSTASERDREQLARETALLIQQEVQRWEASVAELEAAVLQRPQQQQQPPNNNANMIFPTMPAVVDVIDERSSHDHSPSPPTVPMSALSPLADLDDTEEEDEEMEDDHEEEEEEDASTTMQ